ncbi:minichromosome maintenance protein 3 [Saprolegnia diclina VS20]|uniref:DNA replication licensing factor MCM3 n=1 Tax=Saprolegnia diclina (strain VS20) TaxID=1156394 RepID=T0RP40_SAPDV|nr:minichromosome maintenance protein 3 [Saprolegnia diclina VS20]EQC34213.1 minichromosome maintenance protein 3 [Saprolegnia diclina VS20]|eukprot:XP_008612525.1 minichromosome maintenance protein 3 [Saprolegnia diclina VS20]
MDQVSGPNDDALRRHKEYFLQYLESDESLLPEKIRALADADGQGPKRLLVDLNLLRVYDAGFTAGSDEANIVSRLLQQPAEYLPALQDAVREAVLHAQSSYNPKAVNTNDVSQIQVGLEGDFGAHFVTPRGLVATFLCQCVCVQGIVTKVSAVRPKVVKSVHYCKETNVMIAREYRDHTSLTGIPTTSVYPTKDENGNLLETEFGLCQYKDYQVITIQETPETAPLGQLPRSSDVIVESDLVDKCKPGDRVRVIGVFRAMASANAASTSGVFRTMLLANNIQLMGKEVNGIVMTTEDLMNVREFAKRPDVFDILARSIAPSIYGHAEIKQALLLQLLGGVEKNLENGTHLRGDINVLMVGDPSTAKSQLLRFVRTIAPLAVNTTGRGSSGVGLTAAVTMDPETKEKRLEAGAMVLADRGIVCIDEFDKMSEADRVAIHEVMEQQTVTIAKAGIHATLNARCSVLAAANPVYGQYNKNKRPQENIGLPDSLLSRFDLLFVVLDKLDRGADRCISDHVLRMHRYVVPGQEGIPLSFEVSSTDHQTNVTSGDDAVADSIFQKFDPLLHGNVSAATHLKDNGTGVLTLEFLKKFIFYAKTRFQPLLTDAAIDVISEGYAELRSQQTARTLPVTARTLETLIRLASAHAKARLSKQIELDDAKRAMALMNYALYNEASHESVLPKTDTAVDDDDTVDEPTVVIQDDDEEVEDDMPSRKKRKVASAPTPAVDDAPIEMDLLGHIALLLNEMRSEEGGDEDMIAVKTILANLKKAGVRTSRAAVTAALTTLEQENKVMYLRDDDAVMFV